MFGHVEDGPAAWARHLLALRSLAAESRAAAAVAAAPAEGDHISGNDGASGSSGSGGGSGTAGAGQQHSSGGCSAAAGAQQRRRRRGVITEFVPLPFVHMQAPIYLKGAARRGPTLRECVLLHAAARLVLHPHITNIQASWWVDVGVCLCV